MKHLKFLLLSITGFVFFLMPIAIDGEKKVALSYIVGFVTGSHMDSFLILTQIVSWFVIGGTLLSLLMINDHRLALFKTSIPGAFIRIAGSFMYITVLNGWFSGAPVADMILDSNTGGVMAGTGGLLTTLYITFFVGIIAMPLLTNFGAVEFIGIMFGDVVERLFRVPGYSAVDAIASFVGDGTIGIVVTDSQYQKGYYNKREAYIIATSFSIVGIAFASAVAEELGFAEIFPVFYGAIALMTMILAFITARLPLRKFDETYFEGVTPNKVRRPKDQSVFSFAYGTAVKKAESSSIREGLCHGLRSIANVYIGFLPIIMLVGTIALIIAEHFTFFQTISQPLIPLYKLLGYNMDIAQSMAAATLVGFADMYLPSLFISGTSSESARFFIGVLAFTQLVFMSETGMILVKSKIGLSFADVIKVFVLRTLMSIPLLYMMTQILIQLQVIGF